MNKNEIKLIMTDEQEKYIRNKANESAIPMGVQVSSMLNEWYLKNKDKLDETDINNLMNLTIRLDDKTEKIYKLFIANMISNLIR